MAIPKRLSLLWLLPSLPAAGRSGQDAIPVMKNENGKDLIVYGGAEFVTSLIENDLIDEYHFFINPSIIGKGLGIFGITDNKSLQAKSARLFDCGIILLQYQKKGGQHGPNR